MLTFFSPVCAQLIAKAQEAKLISPHSHVWLQDDRVRQYENYMNLEEQVNKNKEKLEGEITAVAQVRTWTKHLQCYCSQHK